MKKEKQNAETVVGFRVTQKELQILRSESEKENRTLSNFIKTRFSELLSYQKCILKSGPSRKCNTTDFPKKMS